MTTKTIATIVVAALVAIVATAVWVVVNDTPAHDVKVKHPTSQPGPAVPQPSGGAR